MREVMDVLKALADPNRVRALLALQEQELCVCQLIELLELAPSTVSKHMSILRQARLVDARKEGRWVYYRAAGDAAPQSASQAVQWLSCCLADTREVRSDAKKLKAIIKINPEELCRRQCARLEPDEAASADCC